MLKEAIETPDENLSSDIETDFIIAECLHKCL